MLISSDNQSAHRISQARLRGELDYINKLRKDQPAEYRKLVLECVTKCPSRGQGHKRAPFNFVEFKQALSKGTRFEHYNQRKLMTYSEFIDWHTSRKPPFQLSSKGAANLWQRLLKDPAVFKDQVEVINEEGLPTNKKVFRVAVV